MWSSPDVVGLFSINVVSFSSNVVLRGLLFSLKVVWKRAMFSVRGDYVLSSLQLSLRQALEAPSEIAGPFLSRAVSKIRMRGYLTRMNAQFRKVVDTLLP